MPKKSEVISEATAIGLDFNPRWPKTRLQVLIDGAKKVQAIPLEPVPKPEPPEMDLQTTQASDLDDRMARYRGKNPPCPKCGAHPVIVTMRRTNYSGFRCRSCEHRWDDDKRGN